MTIEHIVWDWNHLLHPGRAVLIGDSVDDVRAAGVCGLRCIVYHPGPGALHDRTHFAAEAVPLVTTLLAAVEAVRDQQFSR